ncbi:glycosyl hydrolase family 8 [Actinokineospora bangkokensis]|uniref:Glycoside hydrolase n=1 Tax=Actinokineospora bangkokensis TaxID=1193682 RepID=A0A1Q9LQX4_9PSEU|nr:glycosyl hydrolase family 8 [Actinokineospora bangkokensis]OLR94403.1 hypothetical protein BJP25_11625 [Actinokineospora bangkokensis]
MIPLRAAVAAVVLAAATACSAGGDPAQGTARAAAAAFLDRYADPDGRVVRRDQGGDTVSEGQAYAMLLAVAAGDADRFRSVWRWSAEHLRRPDGLLSWRWVDGRVSDPNSATDADLDAARALVVAGTRFADPALAADGRALATAVLDHATAEAGGSRFLVAGNWARAAPPTVNPSYLSPAATTTLARATGDPRWAQVAAAGRGQLDDLMAGGGLPPDWSTVDGSGRASPTALGTAEPQYGLDAARTAPRFAESCAQDDRAVAARAVPRGDPRGVHALDGTPRVDWQHPLGLVAAAAADPGRRAELLDRADALQAGTPTYYGAAWTALGRVLLTTDLLSACEDPA